MAACGGAAQKRVRKPGDEYLKDIKLEGVDHLSHSGLLSGLALTRNKTAGRAIDEYQLGLDTQRIIGLYQRRGYFSVTVVPRVEHKGDAQILIFKVVEGPRATAQVVIAGLPPEVPYAEARALVTVENGAEFDYDMFDLAKAPMLALVENAGYAHAQLDAQVLADRAKARATLRYTFDPGDKVLFGPITISGVDGALAEAAKSRVPIREGQPYSTKAIAQTQEAILGIRRFSSVRVDVDRMSEATVLPVKIVLREARPLELKGGGGVGFDPLTYQVRAIGIANYDGWPTPLTRVGAEFRPAYAVPRDTCAYFDVWNCEDPQLRVRLIGTVVQQDFLRRDVKADMEGGLDYLQLEAFTMQGARARLGVELPFAQRRVQARVGWQFAYYTFDNYALAVTDPADPMARIPDPELIAKTGTERPERLGAFSETIAVDFRDNPIAPHRGIYAEMRVTQGGSYAGGAFDYVHLMPDLRGYVPLGAAVLAARARVGAILGDVAPTERFFGGGASSQRGFPERYLSPTDSGLDFDDHLKTVPIGGAAMMEAGVELRAPFELFDTPMGFAVFLDGGDVTLTPDELDPTHLHWAAGFSLRPFYLPIGPIRLDFAWRLNRTGAGEPRAGDRFNFVFSLGEAF